MKKGQVSIEFVTIATFMLILFTVLFFSIQNRMVMIKDGQNLETLQQVGNLVSNEIRLASQVGDGYSRTFTLPTTLNGQSYSVKIESETDLVVSYNDLEYVSFLEIPVIGSLNKGENTLVCCNADSEAELS